jgi:hypothetical protein
MNCLRAFPPAAPTSRLSTKRQCGPSPCGEEHFWQVLMRLAAASLPLPPPTQSTARPRQAWRADFRETHSSLPRHTFFRTQTSRVKKATQKAPAIVATTMSGISPPVCRWNRNRDAVRNLNRSAISFRLKLNASSSQQWAGGPTCSIYGSTAFERHSRNLQGQPWLLVEYCSL